MSFEANIIEKSCYIIFVCSVWNAIFKCILLLYARSLSYRKGSTNHSANLLETCLIPPPPEVACYLLSLLI